MRRDGSGSGGSQALALQFHAGKVVVSAALLGSQRLHFFPVEHCFAWEAHFAVGGRDFAEDPGMIRQSGFGLTQGMERSLHVAAAAKFGSRCDQAPQDGIFDVVRPVGCQRGIGEGGSERFFSPGIAELWGRQKQFVEVGRRQRRRRRGLIIRWRGRGDRAHGGGRGGGETAVFQFGQGRQGRTQRARRRLGLGGGRRRGRRKGEGVVVERK